MKKTTPIFGIIMLATFLFASCGGNSIEKDAKKVAELQCKAQELMQEAMSGDNSAMEKSTDLAAEAAELTLKLQEKYTSADDQKKFAEALQKEIGKCK